MTNICTFKFTFCLQYVIDFMKYEQKYTLKKKEEYEKEEYIVVKNLQLPKINK